MGTTERRLALGVGMPNRLGHRPRIEPLLVADASVAD